MTTPLITIQISVILAEDGLELVYESSRVTRDAYKTASFELDAQEAASFEVQDFVADGHTYRVYASHSTRDVPPYAWERLANCCRSPIFADPVRLDLSITAVPAAKGVPTASTTSTTVITKKGKPFPLDSVDLIGIGGDRPPAVDGGAGGGA